MYMGKGNDMENQKLKNDGGMREEQASAELGVEYLRSSVAGQLLMRELELPAEALLQGPSPE